MEILLKLEGNERSRYIVAEGPDNPKKAIQFRMPNQWSSPVEIQIGKETVWVDAQELKRVIGHL